MGAREDLKKRRKELGLTLEEVAEIVGVGKSTVRKWETGFIANMKTDKIEAYAKALKTTPIFIMGLEEDQQAETYYNNLTEEHKCVVKMFDQCSKDSQNRIMTFIKNVFEMDQAEREIKKAEEIPAEYLDEEEMLRNTALLYRSRFPPTLDNPIQL